MFFPTSSECCNEMLHIYNTMGVDYALELGAPVNCLVVDACGSIAADDTTANNGDDGGGSTTNNASGATATTNNNDTGGGVYHPYYPDITSGKCYNDGRQSEFQVHLYDTLSDCVSFVLLLFSFYCCFLF